MNAYLVCTTKKVSVVPKGKKVSRKRYERDQILVNSYQISFWAVRALNSKPGHYRKMPAWIGYINAS